MSLREETKDSQAFLADGILAAGKVLSSCDDALPSQMPGWPNAYLRAEATRHGEGRNRAAYKKKQTVSAAESSWWGQLVNAINEARQTLPE